LVDFRPAGVAGGDSGGEIEDVIHGLASYTVSGSGLSGTEALTIDCYPASIGTVNPPLAARGIVHVRARATVVKGGARA
jgi:hypothetical protein